MASPKKKEIKEDSLFNLDEFIKNYECSDILKNGFKYFLEVKKLKINSEKDFEKEFSKYKNIKLGE